MLLNLIISSMKRPQHPPLVYSSYLLQLTSPLVEQSHVIRAGIDNEAEGRRTLRVHCRAMLLLA